MFKSVRLWVTVSLGALGLAAISAEAVGERSCPNVGFTLVEPSASEATRPVKLGDQTLFVRRNALTTTRDIAEIKIAGDDVDTLILIRFNPDAAAKLSEATTDHEGLVMAFVVDDDVLLAFTWQGRWGIDPRGSQLSILHGMARAQRLVESIRGCTGNKPSR
jgi:preprotein translocase subunit SecD